MNIQAAQKFERGFCASGSQAAGTVRYYSHSYPAGNEYQASLLVTMPFVVTNMIAGAGTPGVGESYEFTLFKNGGALASTTITLTDLVGVLGSSFYESYAVGDTWSIRCTTSAAATVRYQKASITGFF